MEKKKKSLDFSGVLAIILCIAIVIIVIPINLLVHPLDIRYDTTPAGYYSLGKESIALLDSVKDRQIEIYLVRDGMKSLDDLLTRNELLPLYYGLKQYDKYDNITVTCFDANANPALAEKINANGLYILQDYTIIVKCGELSHKISINTVVTPSKNGGQDYAGERLIAGAIKTVTEDETAKVYYLTGHGEQQMLNANSDKSYDIFQSRLLNVNYHMEELNLEEAEAVPDDAEIVYLVGPLTDITAGEKNKLMDFADRGGNMTFFMPPNAQKMAYYNIEEVIGRFGIKMDYNRIKEQNEKLRYGDPYIPWVEYPSPRDTAMFDLTSEIQRLSESGSYFSYMPESRSFQLSAKGYMSETHVIDSIMRTTQWDGAYTAMSEVYGGVSKDVTDVDNVVAPEGFDLGMCSYEKETEAKLAVFGNSEFINNELMLSGITTLPTFLVFTTITWMYNSDINVNIADKARAYDYMRFTSSKDANQAMVILYAAPCAVALIGALIWWRRRGS